MYYVSKTKVLISCTITVQVICAFVFAYAESMFSHDGSLLQLNMSRVMRKPDFCICENKEADQLRGNREADQRLCFCYTDNAIPLLPKSQISNLQPSSVAVQPGLCRTWSKTPKTGFLTTRLNMTHMLLCSVYTACTVGC